MFEFIVLTGDVPGLHGRRGCGVLGNDSGKFNGKSAIVRWLDAGVKGGRIIDLIRIESTGRPGDLAADFGGKRPEFKRAVFLFEKRGQAVRFSVGEGSVCEI